MVDSISAYSSSSSFERMQLQSLTDEQKEQVTDILSNYDADNITEEDAKEIFTAFKDAGIQGAGLKEAIDEAGFDAEELRTKGMGEEGAPPPPPPSGAFGDESSSTVNVSALQSLQDILSNYDLSNLSEDDETSLTSQLQAAGFDSAGILFDLKS